MKQYIIIISALLLLSCQEKPSESSDSGGFDEFESFYEIFHQDSLFQLEHIIFPLQGMPTSIGDNPEDISNFKWQKSDWLMHRPIDPDGEFKQVLTPIDEALIIEKIVHQSGSYAMERRFAKLGDDWYLIYYAGLNRMVK